MTTLTKNLTCGFRRLAKKPGFPGIALVVAIMAALAFLGWVRISIVHTPEEIRDGFTIERACQFGKEIELVATKGDVVRLTYPENASGRSEFFLLPKADTLEWRFPYRTFGVQKCSTGGRRYELAKTNFFGIKGAAALVRLKVSEGPDNRVTIRFLLDDRRKLEPDMLEHMRRRAQERVLQREEESGGADDRR